MYFTLSLALMRQKVSMIIFASIILLHCTAGEILQQPIRSKNKDFVMEFQTQKYECTNQILNTKGRGWDSGILCYDPSRLVMSDRFSDQDYQDSVDSGTESRGTEQRQNASLFVSVSKILKRLLVERGITCQFSACCECSQ